MIRIPEELFEQVERGNVLLFVGERVVRDADGLVVIDQLTAQLATRADLDSAVETAFPDAAQAYEDKTNRQALVQLVRDYFEVLGDEPQLVHRLIARLSSVTLLATTCLDLRLERAFKEIGRPLDVIIGNVDLAFEDERKPQLYQLRGTLDRVDSLVLTEDDYESFFDNQASISVVLQGFLARKTILFIGYDLADAHFKRLYRKVTALLDGYARRDYAFSTDLDPKESRWCDRHGIKVIEIDTTAFLESLIMQLATRAQPSRVALQLPLAQPAESVSRHPYKLLDYYEVDDTAIFFGRQQEAQTLSALIHAHRLVLLYGASGVGKTSLLMAGAIPRLEHTDPPYTAILVRALEDPALVIRRAVRRRLPSVDLPDDGALVDFLSLATAKLGGPLVIVLDQFEEFFIRLSQQSRAAFIAELGALYDAREVPIKIVLSLREDWLAAVGEIESRIPEIFRTRMRLLPLTREQAYQAITAPVGRLGITYEPALVEQLLDDLIGSQEADVMPPQLQLVCSALYRQLEPDARTITLVSYETLGGARGVFQQYVEEELEHLGRDERTLARGALEELVTSQGTKSIKTVAELARVLEVEPAALAPVLEKLLSARLLHTLEREDGTIAYELAHEYLIREIGVTGSIVRWIRVIREQGIELTMAEAEQVASDLQSYSRHLLPNNRGDYAELIWQSWRQEISRLLVSSGNVTTDVLTNIPMRLRDYAVRRYIKEHSHFNLLYDDRTLSLHSGQRMLLLRARNDWDEAYQSIRMKYRVAAKIDRFAETFGLLVDLPVLLQKKSVLDSLAIFLDRSIATRQDNVSGSFDTLY